MICLFHGSDWLLVCWCVFGAVVPLRRRMKNPVQSIRQQENSKIPKFVRIRSIWPSPTGCRGTLRAGGEPWGNPAVGDSWWDRPGVTASRATRFYSSASSAANWSPSCRAVRLEVGFMRLLCSNGVIFAFHCESFDYMKRENPSPERAAQGVNAN